MFAPAATVSVPIVAIGVVGSFSWANREIEESRKCVGVGVEAWRLPSDPTSRIDDRHDPLPIALVANVESGWVLVVLQLDMVRSLYPEPVAARPRDAHKRGRGVLPPEEAQMAGRGRLDGRGQDRRRLQYWLCVGRITNLANGPLVFADRLGLVLRPEQPSLDVLWREAFGDLEDNAGLHVPIGHAGVRKDTPAREVAGAHVEPAVACVPVTQVARIHELRVEAAGVIESVKWSNDLPAVGVSFSRPVGDRASFAGLHERYARRFRREH
jgi:hypothetical protein